MNAYVSIYTAICVVVFVIGSLISILFSEWDWFARSGSVVVAITIYFFVAFDGWVRSYHDISERLYLQIAGRLPPDGDEEYLEFLKEKNLMQDIAENPDEAISEMRENMEKLYKYARKHEGFLQLWVL